MSEQPQRTLAEALAAAQAELRSPQRSGRAKIRGNTAYKYATLDDILDAVRPILAKHGIALSQMPGILDGYAVMRTRLWVGPADGPEFVEAIWPMWRLDSPPDPHNQGSAATYAKRYSLESVIGVVGADDDDGHRAQKAHTHTQGSNGSGRPAKPKPSGGGSSGRPSAKSAATPSDPPDNVIPLDGDSASKRHESYDDNTRKWFCARLRQFGLEYSKVADATERIGWGRPSWWDDRWRESFLQGLAAERLDGRNAWEVLGIENPHVKQVEGA